MSETNTTRIATESVSAEVTAESSPASYFDGKLIQLIGWSILAVLVTICTFGICFPWAYCMILRWYTKHTVIDGKRLYFDGTAMQLFGNWLKWLFFTIITLGIYSFWVVIKLAQWQTKHTHCVD